MDHKLWKIVEANPVIAAVKDMADLDTCLRADMKVIFILFGDICNIGDIVDRVKQDDNIIMVHIDLITGLSGKEVAVDYIREHTKADGILTTKQPLIKRAKELGMYSVLRFFVIDSMALLNIEKQTKQSGAQPDLIEILPGVMPKIIKKVVQISKIPVIAGGLITDKEDVMSALSSGAVSISSTNHDVWFM